MITRKSVLRTLLIAIPVLILIIYLRGVKDCADRDTITPGMPVHADSILMNETTPFDYSGGKIIERRYGVADTPEAVIEFYKSRTRCAQNALDNKILCWGKAEPFGSYRVQIDISNPDHTLYHAEISWDRCGFHEGVSLD